MNGLRKLETAKVDLIICIAGILLILLFSSIFDLSEKWRLWTERHEDWELDEVLVALGVGSVMFAWYAARRWWEYQAEAARHAIANQKFEEEIQSRLEIEKTLKENETSLVLASKIAKFGYYVWDVHKHCCIYCSDEHAENHGVTPEEFIQFSENPDDPENLLFFAHPDDKTKIRKAMRRLIKGETADIEYRTVSAKGEIRFVRQLAKPIFDEDGNLVRSIGTSQNLTETKKSEAELRQAQKMEAVGQLTAGVAHDFNNFLAVILGNAELLAEKVNNSDQSVDAIIAASTKGSKLTQQLLSYSRQQTLLSRDVDLEVFLADLEKSQKTVMKNLWQLEITTDPDCGSANVDPRQLEIALINLIQNATEAMPSGGLVQIDCHNLAPSTGVINSEIDKSKQGYVVIVVTDHGVGMSPETQSKAIEPFYTTKPMGEGHGLGLSMVYGFAKQSGGYVSISSEQGKGTVVKVNLPSS